MVNVTNILYVYGFMNQTVSSLVQEGSKVLFDARGHCWRHSERRASVRGCTRGSGAMVVVAAKEGIKSYYKAKIEELEINVRDKTQNLRRLEAQRNELNGKGGFLGSMLPTLARCSRELGTRRWAPAART